MIDMSECDGHLTAALLGTSASCPKAYRQPNDNFAIVGCGANNVSTAPCALLCLASHNLQVNLAITFCD